ncbi:MAG: hypothetical protein BYD32DRAFT_405536 [Podila humilis]|nr:MAG: hypothetical protein BYD32DRAFT_405536 [Podila humilis]
MQKLGTLFILASSLLLSHQAAVVESQTSCPFDLTLCTINRDACQANLGTCQANNLALNSAVNTCITNLSALQGDMDTCTADLSVLRARAACTDVLAGRFRCNYPGIPGKGDLKYFIEEYERCMAANGGKTIYYDYDDGKCATRPSDPVFMFRGQHK